MSAPTSVVNMEKEAVRLVAEQKAIRDAEQVEIQKAIAAQGQPEPQQAPDQQGAQPEEKAVPEQEVLAKPERPDRDADYWKSRFDVVSGKYNTEKSLDIARIRELEAILADQQAKPQPSSAPSDMSPTDAVKWLTEEYGESFVKNMREMLIGDVRSEIDARVNPVQNELREASKRDTASRAERYYSDLTKLSPEWQVSDQDPEFISWLESRKVAGVSYKNLLRNAHTNMDANSVAEIFNEWKPAREVAPKQIDDRAKYVAPDKRSAPVSPKDEPVKPIIYQAQITDMSNKKAQGKISEADWKTFLQGVMLAQQEGRVR